MAMARVVLSIEFLRQRGQDVRLATYDARMRGVARRLGIVAYPGIR